MSRVLDLWMGMAGTVLPFAGAAAPEGWLLCYGQAVSRSAYPHLFSVIGTTYGAGDGVNTFNVPDLRGRVAAGKDNMGGSAANRMTAAGGVEGATLGSVGGSQTHTLTESQIPAHTHSILQNGNDAISATGLTTNYRPGADSAAGGATGAKGGGGAHPNVQPTIVLNSIIKT